MFSFQLADRFADRVVTATTGGSASAAAALSVSDTSAPSVDDVGKALDWWAETAFKTDAEVHRLELEEKRYGAGTVRYTPHASWFLDMLVSSVVYTCHDGWASGSCYVDCNAIGATV